MQLEIEEIYLWDGANAILCAKDDILQKVYLRNVYAYAIALLPTEAAIKIKSYQYTPYQDFDESGIAECRDYLCKMDLQDAYPIPHEKLATIKEFVQYIQKENTLDYRFLNVEAFADNIIQYEYFLGNAVFTFKEMSDLNRLYNHIKKVLKPEIFRLCH
ncbi:hypothetical protein [Plebeiibacterium marinum]|uniref:Uncharacterized protein n=1 Tax=Plebeiibacterium marinum TaxID=2992111 RepID=A0AAE3ME82_9BACT|nr:hypothetical protein [Plebeiobacterium marinum]MCW3806188.1 hypothetical protein [Plebeiobacterium marinum]